MDYDYYGWYEPSIPLDVKGGIRAKSKRGAFARTWWGRRWIETLESFGIGARLARGRSYARKGQVAGLEISRGCIAAEVQGSENKPYEVLIDFEVFTEKQWQKVIARLMERPIFAALLLGNEMPADIEQVFKDEGLSLFPEKEKDLKTGCSCPDWSNPCKHIAAVFYIIAEAFDNDPFILFELKGMKKELFLNALRKGEGEGKNKIMKPEPLPAGHDEFWKYEKDTGRETAIVPAELHAAMPRRLGHIPFWRSERDFIEEMEAAYKMVSGYAMELFEKDPAGKST
jgi:uncharacterized Zn finger protein